MTMMRYLLIALLRKSKENISSLLRQLTIVCVMMTFVKHYNVQYSTCTVSST